MPASTALAHLVGRQRQDRRGRVAERLDLVGVLAAALEQERDPAQGGDRPAVVRRSPVPADLVASSNFLLVHTRWTRRCSAGQRRCRRAGRACSSTADRPELLSTVRPPVQPVVHSFVHRVVHRGDAPVALTRVARRCLACAADEAPGPASRRSQGEGKCRGADTGASSHLPAPLPGSASPNTGARFSRAARMPSCRSSVARVIGWASASHCRRPRSRRGRRRRARAW